MRQSAQMTNDIELFYLQVAANEIFVIYLQYLFNLLGQQE